MRRILIGLYLSINICFALALPKHSLNINNSKLDYYKVGHGQPVVLIMGYGLTNNFWPKPFINCLSINHTVYILDYISISRPDMNLMVDTVHNFIIQNNLDHPEVIGWSMGGGIALSLADKYRYSVSKIGLISSVIAEPGISQLVTPYEAKDNSDDEKLDYVFGNNIYKYQSKNLSKYKKEMLSNKVFVNDKILALQKAVLANWMSDSANGVMINRIKVPMNVIIAKHDLILNPEVQLQAFNGHPKTQITIMDSGHASFYEDPKQVCEAVLK